MHPTTEITSRFPTDRMILETIARSEPRAAASAFALLSSNNGPGMIVVACWTRPQSGYQRYPIEDARTLSFVVKGVLKNSCTNLRFFAIHHSQAPSGEVNYHTMFTG